MTQLRAAQIFWMVAIVYGIVWTALPSVTMPGYILDVPEMIFIGKEWVIGYHKHPTLHTWLVQTVDVLTNRAHFAPFLTAQLCVFVCFWSSWRVARKIFSEEIALLATFSMVGYYYYAYQAVEYNNHLPLMACVSLTTLFLTNAFDTNKTRWWVATGLAIGSGMLCKYPMVFLAFSIVVFMLVNKQSRSFWRFRGPYLTILTAALVFLPHFIWLIQNDFSPLKYADRHTSTNMWVPARTMLEFCVFSGVLVLPVIITLLPLTSWKWRPNLHTDQEKFYFSFLGTTMLGVFACFVFVGIVKQVALSTAFSSQIWPMFGVLWAFGIRSTLTDRAKKTSIGLMALFAMVMCGILLVAAYVVPHYKGRPTRFLFPATELAQKVDILWDSYYETPCEYVAGEWWISGNVARRMKSDPHVYAYMSADHYEHTQVLSSWCTRDDVVTHGGMVFWTADNSRYENDVPRILRQEYPDAVVLPPITVTYHRTHRPLQVGVAIVPIPNITPRKPLVETE